MKKYFITILLAYSSCTLLAQMTFAPIGTKWKYNYLSYGVSSGYVTVEAVSDTTIANLACRKLQFNRRQVKCDFNPCSPNYFYAQYLHQKNDSLFDVDKQGNKRLLIDFKCKIDDILWLKGYNTDSVLGVVRRITDTLINGKRLKLWEIHYCVTNSQIRKLTFVENLFFLNTQIGLFRHNALCTGVVEYIDELCSFENSDWQYQRITCTQTNTLDFGLKKMNIYPNPSSSQIFIESSHSFSEYTIFDSRGKIYQSISKIEGNAIDINNLPRGIYFIQLFDKQGFIMINKFVKI